MASLVFDFEEQEIDGRTYRLPILNMNRAVFKKIGKSSYKIGKREEIIPKEQSEDRYQQAKEIYKGKARTKNDKPASDDVEENEDYVEDPEQEESDQEDNEDFEDNFFGDEEEEEKISTEKPQEMNKAAPVFKPKQHPPSRPRPLTHFMCLPITHKGLAKKLVDFQYKVDAFDKGRSVVEGWYIGEGLLNITLFRLPLETKERVEEACKLLQSLQPEIEEFLGQKKLNLNLKGVGDFKINDRESQVLFAKLSNNKPYEILCELVDWIKERMISSGLVTQQELKREPFHLALINSSHMKIKNELRGFNGNAICSKFHSESLGTFAPQKISLCSWKMIDGHYIKECDISI
ncbi:unnamed protein product [Moneuplotes crassus]|uniref:A-kinase anchor protein 7-like phosphoesterase domain-containing protein n=1 Tax=Euplotes crassus TaxID=5936 RepID=A0AAD1XKI6_EUPCR|nr:unnamed protein product [Moneuplotes crassus]